ncbi:signal peptidase I [Patescibacteria group bacterium]|nr:signal peptidase I [Patescibacteria group bacterium]MBU4162330.1 signal peptidase I [Patescibacteria group bacterium]
MKKIIFFIWEIVKISIVALIIVVPIRAFVFQPFFVSGASMEPNFHDYDYLIVDEISYRLGSPGRGDVIVFYNPNDTSKRLIKRVIGLSGETIKIVDNQIFIKNDDEEFYILDESEYLSTDSKTAGHIETMLGDNQYFVLGDNRNVSLDSRSFGPVNRDLIIGRSAFRLWPLSVFMDK